MEYSNFVFYGSWRETLDGFKEDFGAEYAKEALWNLMTMATAGDIETEKKSIIGFVQGCCMPNIEAAQSRYEKACANGAKGGRPTTLTESDNTTIAFMRKQGKKQTEIAEAFNVSVDTIRRSNGWKNCEAYGGTQQNPAKPSSKMQNPDKDIDIENEKEKEKEKEKDNTFGFGFQLPTENKIDISAPRHIDTFHNGVELQAFKRVGGTVLY